MSALLTAVTGWLVVGVLASISRRLDGSWLTPFVFLAIPFQAVVTLALLFAPAFGFLTPEPLAMLSLLGMLAVFWLGEIGVLAWAQRRVPDAPPDSDDRWRPSVEVVSWVLIAVTAQGFIAAFQNGGPVSQIVEPAFQLRYGSGAAAWVRPLLMLLLVYWIGFTERWTLRRWLLVGGLGLFIGLSFVRGTIVISIAAGLLLRFLARRRMPELRHLAAIPLLLLAMALAVSAVEVLIYGWGGVDFSELAGRLVRRTAGYLLAGVLAFSGSWQQGMHPGPDDWHILVSPTWNILARFTGWERIYNVNEQSIAIDFIIGASGTSNVRTMPGTLWYYAGWLGASLGMLAMGIGLGLVHATARRTRNSWLLVVSAFTSAALLVGWFEYYFWHFFYYQAVLTALVAAMLLRFRRPIAMSSVQVAS